MCCYYVGKESNCSDCNYSPHTRIYGFPGGQLKGYQLDLTVYRNYWSTFIQIKVTENMSKCI